VETLAQLRSEGKIRLIALSNVTQEHIERARRSSLLSPYRTATALRTAMDYVVDYCDAMELLLFLGSLWELVKLPARC